MGTQGYPRSVTAAALLVAVAAGVYVAVHAYDPVIRPLLDVLPPFVIAFVFAYLLDPVVDWIQARGLSRGFGVAIVGIAFLVVFLAAGFVLVPRALEQAGNLASNFGSYSEQIQKTVDGLLARFTPALVKLHLPTTSGDWTARFSSQIEAAGSAGLSFLAGSLSAMLSRALWIIIIPLTTLWFLKDLDYFRAKIVYLTPERHKDRLMRVSSAVAGVFGRYVRGMLTVAIIFSGVTTVVLGSAGLDYALIVGGVSGLFYLVPYLGVVTLASITGIAALVQPGMGSGLAIALFIYLLVQSFVVFDLLITPRIVGGSVGVHPVLMLLSLALGARLFGVVGMLAAVPVAAACQVALGQFYPRIFDRPKPLAVGPEPAAEDPVASRQDSAG